MTPKNLARLTKETPDSLRNRFLREEIFAHDEEAFLALRRASDGFEHGYMAVDDVRGLVEPVLTRSMGIVRRALIVAAGVDRESQRSLLADYYSEPRGLVPAIWIVTGEVSREDPSQPVFADGSGIELAWESTRPVATRTPEGETTVSFPWGITIANLPSNVRLELSRTGVRAAYLRPTSSEPIDVTLIPARDKWAPSDEASDDNTDPPA